MTARLEKCALEGQFRLIGELSFASVPELDASSVPVFRGCPELAIDLSGVARSDSAGLALLIEWARRARQVDQALRYTGLTEQMLELVRVSGLDKVLPFYRGAPAAERAGQADA
jgi:phospholipid transport system transporter-binding protein